MPCYDSRNDPAVLAEEYYQRGYENGIRRATTIKLAGNKTQLLCLACATMEKHKMIMPKPLRIWYKRHQKIDRLGKKLGL